MLCFLSFFSSFKKPYKPPAEEGTSCYEKERMAVLFLSVKSGYRKMVNVHNVPLFLLLTVTIIASFE